MNTTSPAPTPAMPSRPGLRVHGATALTPGAGGWLPPRTRITHVCVEHTPEGERLVYAYVRDTFRYWISLAVALAVIAGAAIFQWWMPEVTLPLLLALHIVASIGTGMGWVILSFPETGPGGYYPVDPEGRLLPKTKKPRLKGLTHKKA